MKKSKSKYFFPDDSDEEIGVVFSPKPPKSPPPLSIKTEIEKDIVDQSKIYTRPVENEEDDKRMGTEVINYYESEGYNEILDTAQENYETLEANNYSNNVENFNYNVETNVYNCIEDIALENYNNGEITTENYYNVDSTNYKVEKDSYNNVEEIPTENYYNGEITTQNYYITDYNFEYSENNSNTNYDYVNSNTNQIVYEEGAYENEQYNSFIYQNIKEKTFLEGELGYESNEIPNNSTIISSEFQCTDNDYITPNNNDVIAGNKVSVEKSEIKVEHKVDVDDPEIKYHLMESNSVIIVDVEKLEEMFVEETKTTKLNCDVSNTSIQSTVSAIDEKKISAEETIVIIQNDIRAAMSTEDFNYEVLKTEKLLKPPHKTSNSVECKDEIVEKVRSTLDSIIISQDMVKDIASHSLQNDEVLADNKIRMLLLENEEAKNETLVANNVDEMEIQNVNSEVNECKNDIIVFTSRESFSIQKEENDIEDENEMKIEIENENEVDMETNFQSLLSRNPFSRLLHYSYSFRGSTKILKLISQQLNLQAHFDSLMIIEHWLFLVRENLPELGLTEMETQNIASFLNASSFSNLCLRNFITLLEIGQYQPLFLAGKNDLMGKFEKYRLQSESILVDSLFHDWVHFQSDERSIKKSYKDTIKFINFERNALIKSNQIIVSAFNIGLCEFPDVMIDDGTNLKVNDGFKSNSIKSYVSSQYCTFNSFSKFLVGCIKITYINTLMANEYVQSVAFKFASSAFLSCPLKNNEISYEFLRDWLIHSSDSIDKTIQTDMNLEMKPITPFPRQIKLVSNQISLGFFERDIVLNYFLSNCPSKETVDRFNFIQCESYFRSLLSTEIQQTLYLNSFIFYLFDVEEKAYLTFGELDNALHFVCKTNVETNRLRNQAALIIQTFYRSFKLKFKAICGEEKQCVSYNDDPSVFDVTGKIINTNQFETTLYLEIKVLLDICVHLQQLIFTFIPKDSAQRYFVLYLRNQKSATISQKRFFSWIQTSTNLFSNVSVLILQEKLLKYKSKCKVDKIKFIIPESKRASQLFDIMKKKTRFSGSYLIDLLDLFQSLDANHDQCVSFYYFRKALTTYFKMKDDDTLLLCERFDLNFNNKVHYIEFLKLISNNSDILGLRNIMVQKKKRIQSQIRNLLSKAATERGIFSLFSVFDVRKVGFISEKDFYNTLHKKFALVNYNQDEITNALCISGNITLDLFIQLCQSDEERNVFLKDDEERDIKMNSLSIKLSDERKDTKLRRIILQDNNIAGSPAYALRKNRGRDNKDIKDDNNINNVNNNSTNVNNNNNNNVNNNNNNNNNNVNNKNVQRKIKHNGKKAKKKNSKALYAPNNDVQIYDQAVALFSKLSDEDMKQLGLDILNASSSIK